MEPAPADRGGPVGIRGDPGSQLGVGDVVQRGPAGRQGAGRRRVVRIDLHLPRLDHDVGTAINDWQVRGTAQPDRAVQRTGNRFVPLVHRLEQVDADPVGEAGNGHLRQFLRGAGHVQRAADTGTRLVQQGQPLLGHMLLADIECRAVHASDPPAPILDRRHTDGQRPAVGVDENGTDNRDVHRLARLYHLAKLLGHLAKLLGNHGQTGQGRQ